MSNTKKILTTGDIATHCQVCYETVANWIKSDKLKSYQTPGRHRRIRLEDFMDFLAEHGMPPLTAEEPSAPAADPNKRRILVVDDEPSIRRLITRSFERKNAAHALCTAADGFEAATIDGCIPVVVAHATQSYTQQPYHDVTPASLTREKDHP